MADGAGARDLSYPVLAPPRTQQSKDPSTAQFAVSNTSIGTLKQHEQATTSGRADLARRTQGDPLLTQLLYKFIGWMNKVPTKKGFSQGDWLRLTTSNPNLNGQGGAPLRRNISMTEVKLHDTKDDAWMVLRNKVYNITPYLKFHPGGPDILLKAAGKDGTSLFMKYHPWVNADAWLEKCLIGHVAKPSSSSSLSKPAQPSYTSSTPQDIAACTAQQHSNDSEPPSLSLSLSSSASSLLSLSTAVAAVAEASAPNTPHHHASPAIQAANLQTTETVAGQQSSS